MSANETTLIELLRTVPIDHRTEWETQWAEDGTPTGHAMCTIGKRCHDAADRLEAAEAKLREVGELADHYERFGKNCFEPVKTIYQNIGCEIKDKLKRGDV